MIPSQTSSRAEQLQFQATILDNVRDSITVSDLEGKIIYWNRSTTEIFGYTAEEMIGRKLPLS